VFCPKCHAEYQKGFSDCASCDIPLVTALPEPPDVERKDWAVVATYRDLGAAQVAHGLLEANDVPCLLADHEVIRLDWRLSTALRGIKLRVPYTDFDRAQELLAASPAPESDSRGDVTPEDLPGAACPSCASKEVVYVNLAQKWSLAFLLLGVPIFARRWGFRCQVCNHSWRVTPPV